MFVSEFTWLALSLYWLKKVLQIYIKLFMTVSSDECITIVIGKTFTVQQNRQYVKNRAIGNITKNR